MKKKLIFIFSIFAFSFLINADVKGTGGDCGTCTVSSSVDDNTGRCITVATIVNHLSPEVADLKPETIFTPVPDNVLGSNYLRRAKSCFATCGFGFVIRCDYCPGSGSGSSCDCTADMQWFCDELCPDE